MPMTDVALARSTVRKNARHPTAWERLKVNRGWLSFWFMLPAAGFDILFLAYPLGLVNWIYHARIGRSGAFIGLENYEWLWDDSVFWMSVFNTLLYTGVASAFKFAIGLYLALLLNQHLPFKAIIRAVVLIPFIVPTVSAIAFWWLFDSQFSIISWKPAQARCDRHQHRLSRRRVERALVGDLRQYLARRPVRRHHPARRPATVSPSLYEAAMIDGANRWQMFRHITYPLLTPIIAVVMTFSVLFTFTDFQLIWAMTRGGPVNATHLMATLSYQRAIHRRAPG